MESLYACLCRHREACIARTQGQADKSGNESWLKKMQNFSFPHCIFFYLHKGGWWMCAEYMIPEFLFVG